MANNDLGLKRYLQFIFFAILLVAFFFVFEKIGLFAEQGLIMGLLEVLLEVGAFVVLWKNQDKIKTVDVRLFKWFFFFLAIGDFFYVSFYYFLHLSSRSMVSATFTTLIYNFSYFIGAVSIMKMHGNLKSWAKNRLNLAVYLLCAPLAARLLLMPFLGNPIKHANVYFVFLEVSAIFGTLLLLSHGLIILIGARNIFWSNLGIGMVGLVISDWALRVEKLIDNQPAFGFYEALYCFAVSVITIPFIVFKDKLPLLHGFNSNSIISKVKLYGLVAAFISVIFLSLSQYGSRDSIRFAAVGCVVSAFVITILSFYLISQISQFSTAVGKVSSATLEEGRVEGSDVYQALPIELKQVFYDTLATHLSHAKEKIALRQAMDAQRIKYEIATQVSHDIKSPLAALELLSPFYLDSMPEEKRAIVRNSIDRIRGIANSLLNQDVRNITPENKKNDFRAAVYLPGLIQSIVLEKQVQFQNELGLVIVSDFNENGYDTFVKVNPVEMERVISNLLNNAIEALENGQGKVILKISSEENNCIVSVTDNGKGISKEVIPKLMIRGNSFNKIGGNGLGLSHAKETIELWGGSISIASICAPALDCGTTVSMRLPMTKSPTWFCEQINLQRNSMALFVGGSERDSDNTMSKLISRLRIAFNQNIEFVDEPGGLRRFYGANLLNIDNVIFFVDFNPPEKQGEMLDIILELGISHQTFLITDFYTDNSLVKICEEKNIKIIPRFISNFGPILRNSS